MSQQDKIRQALRELVNAAERHLHGEVAPVAHAIHQAKDLLDQQEADQPCKDEVVQQEVVNCKNRGGFCTCIPREIIVCATHCASKEAAPAQDKPVADPTDTLENAKKAAADWKARYEGMAILYSKLRKRIESGELVYADRVDMDRQARLEVYADRYEWLRNRPLDAINQGGVFAGLVPDNVVLNGDDLDEAIDKHKESANGSL